MRARTFLPCALLSVTAGAPEARTFPVVREKAHYHSYATSYSLSLAGVRYLISGINNRSQIRSSASHGQQRYEIAVISIASLLSPTMSSDSPPPKYDSVEKGEHRNKEGGTDVHSVRSHQLAAPPKLVRQLKNRHIAMISYVGRVRYRAA